jgi:hypothetical protein
MCELAPFGCGKIERRSYSEAGGLRQPRPTKTANGPDGREERGRPNAPPAHKVTRANDSNGLGALLRNFFRGDFQLRRAPKDEDGQPAGPFRLMPGEAGKLPKTKGSFRQAKRNVSQRTT